MITLWNIATHVIAFLLGALVWFEFMWWIVTTNEKRD